MANKTALSVVSVRSRREATEAAALLQFTSHPLRRNRRLSEAESSCTAQQDLVKEATADKLESDNEEVTMVGWR